MIRRGTNGMKWEGSYRLNPPMTSSRLHSSSSPPSYTSLITLFALSPTPMYTPSAALSTLTTKPLLNSASSASPKCFSTLFRSVSMPRRISLPSYCASSLRKVLRLCEARAAIAAGEVGEVLLESNDSVDSRKSRSLPRGRRVMAEM